MAIRAQERSDGQSNDSTLNRDERPQLNRESNRNSRLINRDPHYSRQPKALNGGDAAGDRSPEALWRFGYCGREHVWDGPMITHRAASRVAPKPRD